MTNFTSKTPLKIKFKKNLGSKIFRNPDPDFWSGLYIFRIFRIFLNFRKHKNVLMICSQMESANMGDLNYRGVIPNVPRPASRGAEAGFKVGSNFCYQKLFIKKSELGMDDILLKNKAPPWFSIYSGIPPRPTFPKSRGSLWQSNTFIRGSRTLRT